MWVADEPNAMGNPFGDALPNPKPEAHGLFRKRFKLKRAPGNAPARISADSRYVLFVNGVEVSRGPVRSQPRRLHYDLFDLAPYLRAGENVVAIYVKYYGTPRSHYMPAASNGTLGRSGVVVFEANVGSEWLVSDGSWRALRSTAWSEDCYDGAGSFIAAGVPAESFDARQLASDWITARFDDAAWPAARVILPMHPGASGRSQPPSDPYGAMLPSPIAARGGATLRPVRAVIDRIDSALDKKHNGPAARAESAALQHPVADTREPAVFPAGLQVPENGFARIVLDMGRIVSGLVQFKVSAPAGTVFDFGYFETPVLAPSMFGAHGGNRYIARGQADAHEAFDPKGFRYVHVLVHGAVGPVTLEDLAVREHVYPWSGGAQFSCNDELLNDIYQAGIRTVQLNSWDAFIDCPTREQRAWVGDAVVHQMVHLATNTDWRLAWHYLTLADSPRSDGIMPMSVAGDIESGGGTGIPDWSLHWIHGVYNLYRYGGDRAQVKAFMPSIERVLRWFLPYRGANGLLRDVVEWNLIDWSSLFSGDCSALVNAGWARGLREFAEMAGWLGERASVAWATELYAGVKASFDLFWDAGRGVYVDYAIDGVPQRPVNQIASALAIVSGLAPKPRWRSIINTITNPDRLVARSWVQPPSGSVTPEQAAANSRRFMFGGCEADWDVERQIVIAEPFMSYVVHDAVALAGLSDRLPELCRRWGQFLTDGYDTLGENWRAGTHVHGWSGTPTKDLIFYTLGVTPAEPGYAVARIAPRLGDLTRIKGAVPTPHGLIKVAVTEKGISIDSPIPCVLDLPGRKPRKLRAGKHKIALSG